MAISRYIKRTMILELTEAQASFQAEIRQFAADRVAPEAAGIDERGVFPRALIREAAALGLMGVTIPATWGGAGRDYVSYALAVEALAEASAVIAVIAAVNNSLVAEPIAEFGSDTQKTDLAPASRDRRGARRVRAVRGARRLGRGQPADGRAARRTGLRHQRAQGVGRQRGGGRPADPLCRDAAGHPRTRHQRVPRADGHPGHHARDDRRLARRPRPRVRGPRAHDVRVDTDALLGSAGRRFPHRDVGARRRTRRDRGAGARGRHGGAARSPQPREIARSLRAADRQLPGDSVDARRHRDRARRGAAADA